MRLSAIAILMTLVFCACGNRNQRFNMDVAVDVTVQKLSPQSIQEMVTVTGDLMPAGSVVLKSEMPGEYYLQRNPQTGELFKMGDKVRKGAVIIKLEDKAYRNTTNIEGERLNLEISEQEYVKQNALYEKGGVTKRELVNAERNLVSARKNYENAQINLDKMSVEAPIDGVITSLPYYSQGVRVDQGAEMIGIMNYQQLVLDVTLPASSFGRVEPGQRSLITNYSSSEDTIQGEVTQLSPALDVSTRSYKGRIGIGNEKGILRPGMFVNAAIVVEQNDSVLAVPPEVVLSQMGGKFVYVVDKETARKRIVQTGLEGRDRIEIVDGLKPGEQVVVEGFETLRDGSKVNIENEVRITL
ncbi:efflux RND transporter periplasmic adaptor subunit [Marinilabilia rubra]|uniref:Efflux transporter periplasmic adaptor subunit n=1 Tax=Marinilabilia rubra TaxID=2162893 RepID=A0A2U2B3K3_9BACT|nr:efflux RND transporter periplasmic adaptor subunit [Marinilabilia rubra]PWD97638.1 efflux transporter periplasmic adaptor subunit [Marinilabilia rubra]